MKDKKVLVVGSGGRCHAIVDALSRSPQVAEIFCAPGNAGIAGKATCLPVAVTDIEGLVSFAKEKGIDLTVVGPEASLVEGIADRFTQEELTIFGPDRSAARIESSKEFAKQLMMRHSIPTGAYKVFDRFEEARDYVLANPLPAVIKYDGLAAGKGVVVAQSYDEAEQALRDMLLGECFGKGRVIVEEFLAGPEFSFMCAVSGEKVYPLAIAQDHKRAFDGDKGPNTGGMGAYSPVPFVTDEIRERALNEIIIPTAKALVAEGAPFKGLLYGGLILTEDGPKVIEFNARFGDPETEVVLPRLKSDIYELFENVALSTGKELDLEWNDETVLGIVLAAEGYPSSYTKGIVIEGAGSDCDSDNSFVYQMGTSLNDGKLVSAGGRVLMAIGVGNDVATARRAAEERIGRIKADGMFHRTDIGKAAIK